jgi:7,8-dihydropterin-6-yl-methyl-4-(beta-D-ribofuranosyl)aminobenzene 5'-phosphate synthase
MKLTVLTDNYAGGRYLAEHGLSYLIEHNGVKILFDTGRSDVFLQNALSMGIDIQKNVETVVLSHGHWDHGDGLRYINGKTLITHPFSFIKRYRKGGKENIGLCLSKNELVKRFNILETAKPYFITRKMVYLGEIPRHNDFESQMTLFVDECGNDDYVPDDSAMAIIQGNELILVTGCSHSGICNIAKYAQQATQVQSIRAIIGGFHLKDADNQTKRTAECLKSMGVKKIYPSHCTELGALAYLNNEFSINQVKTGQVLNF